jgi:hypothetical protein
MGVGQWEWVRRKSTDHEFVHLHFYFANSHSGTELVKTWKSINYTHPSTLFCRHRRPGVFM